MASRIELDSRAFEAALAAEAARMATQSAVVVEAVGKEVVKIAKRLAPERTGRLKRSIKSTPGHDAKGPYAEISVGPFYASFREWGTVNDPAEPFMRPALETAKSGVARLSRRIRG